MDARLDGKIHQCRRCKRHNVGRREGGCGCDWRRRRNGRRCRLSLQSCFISIYLIFVQMVVVLVIMTRWGPMVLAGMDLRGGRGDRPWQRDRSTRGMQ